jgi:hypothetical protein
MEQFNQYLNDRMEYLLNTQGNQNKPLVELERAKAAIEGQTIDQAQAYLNERITYLRNTRGNLKSELIELVKAAEQLKGVA